MSGQNKCVATAECLSSERSELRYRGAGAGKRRCDSVNSSELDELTAKLIVGLASGALPPRLVKFSDLEVG